MGSRAACGDCLRAIVIVAGLLVVASCSKASDAPPPPPPVAATPAPAQAPPPATAPVTPPVSSPSTSSSRGTQTLPAKASDPVIAKNADVVVKDMADPRPVSMRVGQTVGILSYAGPDTWQVDADPDALILVTPAERVSRPGDRGWIWRAVRPGTAQVVLTSRAPCPNPPCGENLARYLVTLQITSRD